MRDTSIDQGRCDELLDKRQIYHSEHQRRWAIVGANSYGGSLYGQLRQALRELASRNVAIEMGELADREIALELEELDRQISEEQNPRVTAKLEIKRDRYRLAIKRGLPKREALLEERAHFFEMADRLDKQLGGLTLDKREELDAAMWFDWIRERLALDIIERGRPLRGTIQAMMTGPPEWRPELLAIIHDVRVIRDEESGQVMSSPGQKRLDLINWYTQRDLPALPADIKQEA